MLSLLRIMEAYLLVEDLAYEFKSEAKTQQYGRSR